MDNSDNKIVKEKSSGDGKEHNTRTYKSKFSNYKRKMLETAIRKILLEEYGIRGGDLREIKCIAANPVFYLGREYFIKLTPKERPENRETYAARLDLVAHLSEEALPVPDLVRTKNGGSFVEVERFYLEVHRYIPDTEYFGSYQGQLQAVAQVLAQIHKTTDRLMLEEKLKVFRRIQSPFSPKESRFASDLGLQLVEYEQHLSLIPEPLRGFLKNSIPLLRERYGDILGLEEGPEENKGIVHGDLHDQQTLFDRPSKRLVAVLDWELAHWRSRAYDVAYTLERVSTEPEPNAIYDTTFPFSELSFSQQKGESFLALYEKEHPLSGIEPRAMMRELLTEVVHRDAKFLSRLFDAAVRRADNFDYQRMHSFLRTMSVERVEKLRGLFG